MGNLTVEDCISLIKEIKKGWKKTFIKVIKIQQFPKDWYRIITFDYKGKLYEYREDASDAWIDVLK